MSNRREELLALKGISELFNIQPDEKVLWELKKIEYSDKIAKVVSEERIKKQHTEISTENVEIIREQKVDSIDSKSLITEAAEILKKKNKTEKNELGSLNKRIEELEDFVNNLSRSFGSSYGSGEVRFKNLDDVERDSVGNTDKVLRYNPETKMFYFDYLSGDQGKIRSLTFDQSGAGVEAQPGMLSWNIHEDCLDITHEDGSTVQVGFEHYIPVVNQTAAEIPQGTVVRFSGVTGLNGWVNPTVERFVADSEAVPHMIIGVTTTNLPVNGLGRATVFGKVRALNTTGSTVSETWNVGDLLWAHPSIPGELTKFKPTAPNVAVSVAAVLKVGSTDGVLLVRPTITPRLFYGSWFDTTNQTASAINTPYPVAINTTEFESGFSIDTVDKSKVIAKNSGLYNFQFSLQVTSSNSSTSNLWIWYRKNGVDVPHSATNLTIASNGGKLAPAWNFVVSMQPNDYFQLMWATNSTAISLSAEPASFHPSVPSVILTVTQVNL